MHEPPAATPAPPIAPADASARQAAARPDRDRSPARWIALGALLVAAATLAVVLLTRDDSHSYKLVFENAGQLVVGDVVRIGGTGVGSITDLALTADTRAEVTVSVNDDFAPLHRGSTATIRAQGLVGVANRYVDIHPGPDFRPEMGDGARVETDDTETIVELDQLFNALDPRTRRGLEGVIEGSASTYEGAEKVANMSARYFAPWLAANDRFVREIGRDSESLQRFLVQTSDTLGVLSERREELTALVGNTGVTMRALGSDTESLSAALTQLPPALEQGSDTFVSLRPAIDDLERLVRTTDDSTRGLAPFLARARPVTARAVPTFRDLRLLFDRPGRSDDLLDALRDLPPIERISRSAFPGGQRALRRSTRIFGFIRPYVPDLTTWLRSFGQATAPYDANGHYARTQAVFDAFEFTDSEEGGEFTPKTLPQRGRSAYLDRGNLRRCPGTAAPSPDGSAPFVDMGELANPDCDPSQVVEPR